MRNKNNIGTGQSTPPEAYPNVLQDALYSDDYELQMLELQAFDALINRAKLWDKKFAETRAAFAAAGGTVTEENGGLRFQLKDQAIFVSDDDLKVSYKKKGSIDDRKILNAAMRATICEFYPQEAIINLSEARKRLLNIHLIKGTKMAVDDARKNAVTLDEILRGKIIWNDEEEVKEDVKK